MTFEKCASSDFSRTRRWLMQAGYRDAMDVNYYFGARILMAAIGFVSVAALTGLKNLPLLIGVTGLGFILPRFILKRMIRDRRGAPEDEHKYRKQKKFGLSFWESLRRTITVDLLRPCASLLRGRTVEMDPFQRVPRIFAITTLALFLVVLAIVCWHP
jgi:hypothetical protein